MSCGISDAHNNMYIIVMDCDGPIFDYARVATNSGFISTVTARISDGSEWVWECAGDGRSLISVCVFVAERWADHKLTGCADKRASLAEIYSTATFHLRRVDEAGPGGTADGVSDARWRGHDLITRWRRARLPTPANCQSFINALITCSRARFYRQRIGLGSSATK